MVEALRTLGEVVPFETTDVSDALPDRALARLLDGRWGKRYLVGHALATSRKRGRALGKRLMENPVDVLVSIAASQDVAFLSTRIPIVQVSDTTFNAIKGFYPLFTNLNPLSSLQAQIQAALSSRRAAHTLAATEWANTALVRDDSIPPEQITTAPFGPAVVPGGMREFSASGPLRLLMVSSDWARKGGPDVLALGEELRRRGLEFELTVVGDAPPLPSWARALGRISREAIRNAYESADVLLEMATSNAAGVVLTDAANCGLPVIAANTGGVSTIVRDGETGFLVPVGDIRRAADRLEELVPPEARRRMSESALHHARGALNWESWAKSASDAFDSVVSSRDQPSARVLSFSPAIPYPGIEHAGGQYLQRLRDALEGSHRVTWATQDRPSVRHAFQQPEVASDVLLLANQQDPPVWRRLMYQLADRLEVVARKLDSQPTPAGPLLDLFTRRDLRSAVRAADVLDFQWAAWTRLAPIARLWNRHARVTFTFHDVMSQKCDREAAKAPDSLRRAKWRVAGFLARQWERKALRIADKTLVFSEKDRDLLDPSHSHNVIVVNPPLASGTMPLHEPRPTQRVLLVGYMARAENVEAFTWFAEEIWPTVRQHLPGATLHVVGGSMPEEVSERFENNQDGIILRGFVEDLHAEYAAANLVVVPLRHGAGVKFKTIEALLAGVPVVTTHIGAEGIGGPELFHGYADSADTFAQAVISGLASASQLPSRARQGELWSRYSMDNFKLLVSKVYAPATDDASCPAE